MSNIRNRALGIALLAGTIVPIAHGQTVWSNPAGGNWNTAGNWSLGVPNLATDATIALPGPYTVAASGSPAARDLNIGNSLVQLTVASGSSLGLYGNVTSAGTITVNPTGGSSNASISFNSPAMALDGGGTIILNGVGSINDANLTASVVTNVLTQATGHTITGRGQIFTSLINNGLVKADGAGKYIQLATTPKTNNSLFTAVNGATLDIENVAVTQAAAGITRADGAGSLVETGGSITGGTVQGINGGIVRSSGTLTLDNVDFEGAVEVPSGSAVSALNSLTNAGSITVNPTGGATNASISFNSPAMTLDGGGTIILNGVGSINDANLTANVGTNVLTQAAGHTITGRGQVHTNLINNGLVKADGAGKYIQLATTPKTNNSLFTAVNGATLDIENVAVTQAAAGVIRAEGTGSLIEASGSIIGGTVQGLTGGIVRGGGALTLDGVDLDGEVEIPSGSTTSALTSLTNTGTITVNPTGGANNAVLSFDSPAITLDGGGTIVLNGVGSINDANLASSAAANVLTQEVGHTIAGRGQIFAKVLNRGILSPGHATTSSLTQSIDLAAINSEFRCTASSVVHIDVAGATAGLFDTVTGVGTLTFVCAGTLEVTHVSGYTGPAVGTFLDIISLGSGVGGVTGTFDTVTTPPLPNQGRYVVVYEADRVRLYATCYANCDGSTAAPVLNVNDFSCFLNRFAAGASAANCDLSTTAPVLNVNDFSCFLNRYAAGCS